MVEKLHWPSKECILDALSTTAFDNIEDLAAANEEIRTLLSSREVD